jgi:hypothetical protein
MNHLKQRLERLEQATKPDTYLAHYVEKIKGEDWESVTCPRYRLENDVKESIFLFNEDDMEL